MTPKDIDDMDAELGALLKAMPQPRPSAELDAAILADAEAALAGKPLPGRPAANDALMPNAAAPRRPGFVSRWKVPLAFAATVMLAVHIVGLQWFASPVYDAPAVTEEPPAAAPATARQEPPSAPALAQEKAAPAARAKAAPLTDKRIAAAQSGTSAISRPQAAPAATATAPAALAKADEAKTESAVARAPVVPAPLQAGAAAQAPEQLAAAQTQRRALAEKSAPATASTGVKGLVAADMQAANRDAPRAATEDISGGLSAARNEMRAPAAAPVPATAPAPQGFADAQPKDPREWLTRIDKLMAADKPKEALDEWARFKKTYPDYPVSKQLLDRIEALKK